MKDSKQWNWGLGFCNLHKGQDVPCAACIESNHPDVVDDSIVPVIDMKIHCIQSSGDLATYRNEMLVRHAQQQELRDELLAIKQEMPAKAVTKEELLERIQKAWSELDKTVGDNTLASMMTPGNFEDLVSKNPCGEIYLEARLANPNVTDDDFVPDIPTPARSLGKSVSPNFQMISTQRSEEYAKLLNEATSVKVTCVKPTEQEIAAHQAKHHVGGIVPGLEPKTHGEHYIRSQTDRYWQQSAKSAMFSDSSLGKSFYQLDLYIKIVLHEHGMPIVPEMVMACRKHMTASLNGFLQSNQPNENVSENNPIDG